MDTEEIKLCTRQLQVIDEPLDDYHANASGVENFDEMLNEIENSILGLF